MFIIQAEAFRGVHAKTLSRLLIGTQRKSQAKRRFKANGSKHKAMSYERMKTRETELRAEVDRWLEAAQAADAQEDKLHGASRRGDEMPGWIADKQKRLAKIREAREALEAEAALPRRRKPKPNAQRRRNARRRNASARGRFPARPQKSPIPRRSATLPIPTAGCS